MSTTTTEPPQYDGYHGATATPTQYRPLTQAQERAVLAYAMYAQQHERLEIRWVDNRMVCQLVRCEDRKRV